MDVFDLLEKIKERPGMYVGSTDGQRDEQLRNLEMLLNGYSLALRGHRIQERVSDFPREFMNYLHGRFGWSTACGPVAAIREAAGQDDEWEMFWRLVAEFRTAVRPE